MSFKQSSIAMKPVELDSISMAETQTLASLDTASTVTVYDTNTSPKLQAQLPQALPSIANPQGTQERDSLVTQYIETLENLLLVRHDQADLCNGLPVVGLGVKDQKKQQQRQDANSKTAVRLFMELLSYVR